jgi:hypothetical protein
MGHLISFQPSRKARASRETPRAEGATILFFMGVRYRRGIETPPTAIEKDSPPTGGVDGSGRRRRKRRG